MEAQVRAAMAKIDELHAQKTEESRRDILTRHDEETAAAVFEVGARIWRTQRQDRDTPASRPAGIECMIVQV